MNKRAARGGVYAAHRIHQRDRILETAQDLFIHTGIDLVTIGDIARASRLTRATIYQYFANKQDIAWAILEVIIGKWRAGLEEGTWSHAGSGYEKLEMFVVGTVDHTIRDPRESSFVSQFNYLYAREGSPDRMNAAFHQGFGGKEDFVAGIVRQGMADGSLRPDLDPDLTRAAILNFIASLDLRLGLLGTKVEAEYGQSIDSIFREICRIFLDGIKARP